MEKPSHASVGVQLAMWRMIASTAEFALRHKALLAAARPYLVLLATAAAAFFLGRTLAGLILSNAF